MTSRSLPDSVPLAREPEPAQRAPTACRAALVTPVGRGAVASILLTGNAATTVADSLWRPAGGPPLAQRPPRIPCFGRWELESGAREEVVICRFSDQQFEIHCHGGPAAADAILATLAARGCQIETWQAAAEELEPDLLAAEARAALALCRTARTARILLAQYQGAWQREGAQLEHLITQGDAAGLQRRLDELLDLAPLGLHLTQPWHVALAGPPNVGKSSLANALAGYQRAIVSDLPGTTRDVLHVELAVHGWPIVLADTAGLRATDERIEASGVRRAQDAQAASDLILVVADLSQPWTPRERELLARHPSALLVHTKADRVPATAAADRPSGLIVSAHTGAGLPSLVDALARRLVPHVPDEQAAVPFTDRQVRVLRELRAAASDDLAETRRRLEQLSRYFHGPRE